MLFYPDLGHPHHYHINRLWFRKWNLSVRQSKFCLIPKTKQRFFVEFDNFIKLIIPVKPELMKFTEILSLTSLRGSNLVLTTGMVHFWTNVVGCTTSVYWTSNKLSDVWVRLFLKNLLGQFNLLRWVIYGFYFCNIQFE